MTLITAKDVQSVGRDWAASYEPAFFEAAFAHHLADSLSMIALARADKRVAAGEALVEATRRLLAHVESEWEGTKGCLLCKGPWDAHGNECDIGNGRAALTAYEAAS